MIEYSGPFSFVRWRGSVAPKALVWAVPSSCLVFVYCFLLEALAPGYTEHFKEPSKTESSAVALFTSILGFLIVFRANLAYGRFWEGISLVEGACSVWLNGVSNLIAFCNGAVEKQLEVAAFQHLLTRLMSALLSISLSDISLTDIETFPPLSLDGIGAESLSYLWATDCKQKVVLQWVQRLVIENERAGVLDVPSPILSRVFQEFSIGIVKFIEARKLTNVPFPFVFAQLVYIMLGVFSLILMPLTCAWYVELHRAAALTFLVVFAFMSIHYISVELEQPFGDDLNDLPLGSINIDFKKQLMTLLEQEAQQTPTLIKSTEEINGHVTTCKLIAQGRLSVNHTALLWAQAISEGKADKNDEHGLHIISKLRFMTKSPFQFMTQKQVDDEKHFDSKSTEPMRRSEMSLESAHAVGTVSEDASMHMAPSWPSLLAQSHDECSDVFASSNGLHAEKECTPKEQGPGLVFPPQQGRQQDQQQEPPNTHEFLQQQVRNSECRGQLRSPSPSPVSGSVTTDSVQVAGVREPGEGDIGEDTWSGTGWKHGLAAVVATQPPVLQGDRESAGRFGDEFGGESAACAQGSSSASGVGHAPGGSSTSWPQPTQCEQV